MLKISLFFCFLFLPGKILLRFLTTDLQLIKTLIYFLRTTAKELHIVLGP